MNKKDDGFDNARKRMCKVRKGSKNATQWVESSGNVFQDFKLPDAEILLLKSLAATEIQRTIQDRKLTQKQAGELMGIPAVKVSNIVCGRWKGYTLDRLFTYLLRLDVEVAINVTPRYKKPRKPKAVST